MVPGSNCGTDEQCDIAHPRSVAVLWMLYKIRRNPLHPLNDELPGPYVPVRVTHGGLVAQRHTYAPPRCRTSQTAWLLFSLSVPLEWSCWPRVWWCGTGWFQEQGQCFFIGLSGSICTIVIYYFFRSLLLVNMLVLWGWGNRTDWVYITLS